MKRVRLKENPLYLSWVEFSDSVCNCTVRLVFQINVINLEVCLTSDCLTTCVCVPIEPFFFGDLSTW